MLKHVLLDKLLVKSTLTKEDFCRAYDLMDTHPVDFDCGSLCGKKCCQEYEPGVGMYLLPNEDCMFTKEEKWLKWRYRSAKHHGYPSEWQGLIQFVECKGTCPRKRRPIQCRTFPLMPYMDQNKQLHVTLDTLSGILLCPLIQEPEKYPLRDEFKQRVLEAWRILSKDPLISANIEHESRLLDEDSSLPWTDLLR
jgi:hypothetical protein